MVALALVALIGAGCGSDAPSESGTASGSSSGTASSTSTGTDKKLTARDNAVKFAQCVREQGVSDFPDPNADERLRLWGQCESRGGKKAVDACRELQPPGTSSAKRSPKQQSASLKFAGWIRENGVKDFPDPVNGQPLVDTRRIPSTATEGGMTILNAAMRKCRDVLEEVLGGQG